MTVIIADSHNFGRRVQKKDNKIIKPRPVGLEWLFLSSDSPLRRLLSNIKIPCIDGFVDLKFENSAFSPSLKPTSIEYFEFDSTVKDLSTDRASSIGSFIALTQWFGLGDMHSDNIFVGIKNEDFICSPIDIESIFEEYTLPSQSLLIPSYLVSQEKSGLSEVFSVLKDSSIDRMNAVIIYSYIETFVTLSLNSEKIFDIINDIVKLEEICSRVRLRSTFDYNQHMSEQKGLKLYRDEILQTEIGDIPYFFRFLNSKDIYFWDTELSYSKSDIRIQNIEKLDAQLPVINDSFIDSKNSLENIKFGIVQLARSFDLSPNKNYTSEYLEVKINYIDNRIEVFTPKGNFQCPRRPN